MQTNGRRLGAGSGACGGRQRDVVRRDTIDFVPASTNPDSSVPPSRETEVRPQTNRGKRLARIEPLAADQSRVVARRQLRRLGWTDNQVDHEIRMGRWQMAASGVVALQNAELSGDQLLWLGVLHAGPGSVLSHLTAAQVAGLRWQTSPRSGPRLIDVMTPKGDLVDPIPGFLFHQTRRPYRRWVRATAGPPRLPLEHAALLAAERDPYFSRAIGLLAACVQQGLSTADRFQHAIPQIRKLRHGKHFVWALDDIEGGAQSFAEINVGRLCARAGLMAPTRQAFRVDKLGRRRYLDCEWVLPDGRVVVLEIDGSFHAEVTNWWQDMKRERSIVITKSTVLRCSTVELRLEPGDVLDDLRRIGVPTDHRLVCAS